MEEGREEIREGKRSIIVLGSYLMRCVWSY